MIILDFGRHKGYFADERTDFQNKGGNYNDYRIKRKKKERKEKRTAPSI